MRLLNTRTLKLEEPQGEFEYAILSHVWGDEEVEFHDIDEPYGKKKGYAKVANCCAQALEDGYQYVWIDTCCIDKSSSAELSEAINSMYRWYADAHMCYAYLEDVPSDEDPAGELSDFRRSKWFKRGWTLQEGIAPRRVEFFAEDWVKIGSKDTLSSIVAAITGVDEGVLLRTLPLTEVSVAKKMSWASRRETTRVEDRAYSLMGIFGVHMPLIYGEGENAFIRLQHEIMRNSNDQSIFAWIDNDFFRTMECKSAFLAPSPNFFSHAARIDRISPTDFARLFPPSFEGADYKSHFSITNRGIQITMPVMETSADRYTAALACSINGRLLGLGLSCEDGLFKRRGTGYLSPVSGPDGKFVVRELIISTAVEVKGPHAPTPYPPIYTTPSHLVCVRVLTPLLAQEGFVFRRHSLGQGLHDPGPTNGSFIWDPVHSESLARKCILAYQTHGEGFVVTITQWGLLHTPCVHINVFTDAGERDCFFSAAEYLWSPCCTNHPNWAFKLLRSGRRVTASVQESRWNDAGVKYDVTISVGHPQCAKARQESKRPRVPDSYDESVSNVKRMRFMDSNACASSGATSLFDYKLQLTGSHVPKM
ncbi:HET-domain-containing protein [Leucogyrophana mollusca]|uniref:HET-domain-containing protein n=1 Tax=Leucogyrophana mollusca TaxID=85980 RepID=A0ACB8BEY1_9AGAM|nr:HET-domain-containing protein [Leucogyrophana mollusca]